MDSHNTFKVFVVQNLLSVVVSTVAGYFLGIRALEGEEKSETQGNAAAVLGSYALLASLVVMFSGLFSYLVFKELHTADGDTSEA